MNVLTLCHVFPFQGIRLFFRKKASDADEARALKHALERIDIYSNSWGPGDKGLEVAGPGPYTQRALKLGIDKVKHFFFFFYDAFFYGHTF